MNALDDNAESMPIRSAGKGKLQYVLFITLVAALGGFLFGYDSAVISGAIGFLRLNFELSDFQTGWAGGSAIVGCIPGAMIAGFLADRFGRRNVLLLAAGLYLISSIGSAIPRTFSQFVLARFIGGLGIGVSSMVCPVYIAEIAPQRHRGRLGALFQLGIVLGIFLVFFVNLWVQRMGDAAWNAHVGWRWMLGSGAIPSVVFLSLLFMVPESPRWLVTRGRIAEGRRVLGRFVDPEDADRQIQAFSAAAVSDDATLGELFGPAYRRPLVIAVVLAIAAQFSGINAVMYYAPEIFKQSSGSIDAAFQCTVWVGTVNLICTFVAIALVDRAGRRFLLLVGSTLQTAALFLAGTLFQLGHGGWPVLVAILIFVGAFAMAMGPVPWILISEIFPARVRGRAVAVSVFAIWVACYIVAQTFPMLNKSLGPATTFYLYACCSLASVIFVALMIPETTGLTLEQIEASWQRRADAPDGRFPATKGAPLTGLGSKLKQ